MVKDNVVYLLKTIKKQNELGDFSSTTEKREVFCFVDSVNSTEFFEASKNGIKAQIRLSVFLFDYENEEEVDFEGVIYRIYRTFKKGDTIELYCEEKVGGKHEG